MERPYAVKTPAECSAIAERNEQLGRRTGSAEHRDMFLRIAATWRRLADLGPTKTLEHGWH